MLKYSLKMSSPFVLCFVNYSKLTKKKILSKTGVVYNSFFPFFLGSVQSNGVYRFFNDMCVFSVCHYLLVI